MSTPGEPSNNNIVCISCGQTFPFAQTVEGRCLRDHALYVERENVKQLALMQHNNNNNSSSAAPANITVTGPTIAMNNQQTTTATAVASQGNVAVVVWHRRRCHGCMIQSWIAMFVCLAVIIAIVVGSSFASTNRAAATNK